MSNPVCSWPSCPKPAKNMRGGLCGMHIERQRAGSPPMDAPARGYAVPIEDRYEVIDSGCWQWKSDILTTDGYGRIFWKGQKLRAHRFMWERLVGPIPDGMVLDHLCRNRACVNPDHLEVVTTRVNNRRGMAPNFMAWRQDRCRRGHRFTPANTYVYKNGTRSCRKCHAERERRRVQALKKGAAA